MSKEFGAWTVVFMNIKPITLSRKVAPTIKALAIWLKEHGYDPDEIMGVLRSATKAQAMITARTVIKLMEY